MLAGAVTAKQAIYKASCTLKHGQALMHLSRPIRTFPHLETERAVCNRDTNASALA